MKQKILILFFSLLAFNSMGQKNGRLPYVIFKFDTGIFTPFSTNSKNASLDSIEVLKIDSIVGLFVKDYNNKKYSHFYPERNKCDSSLNSDDIDAMYGHSLILLKNYKMQLVAVTDDYGAKIVWVNCFCGDMDDDIWQTKIVIVDDGDNCFFELKINLSKNGYYDSYVHGG